MRSIGLHLASIGLVLVAILWPQQALLDPAAPTPQEADHMVGGEHQTPAEQTLSLSGETLLTHVTMRVREDLLDTDLQPIEQQWTTTFEADLRRMVYEITGGMDRELDPEELARVYQEARQLGRELRENLLATQLMQVLDDYVRTHLTPRLAADAEHDLKVLAGPILQDRVIETLLEHDTFRNLDEAQQRAVVATAVPEMLGGVQRASNQAIASAIMPTLQKRLTRMLEGDLERLGITSPSVLERVERSVAGTLRSHLAAISIAPEPALVPLRHHFQLERADSLTAAAIGSASALSRLRELRERQAHIRQAPPPEAIDKAPLQQNLLKELIVAYAGAADALRIANRTSALDDALRDGWASVQDRTPVHLAEDALTDLEAGRLTTAVRTMLRAEQALEAGISVLEQAAAGLQAEIAERPQEDRDEVAPVPETADPGDIIADVADAVAREIPAALAHSAHRTAIGGGNGRSQGQPNQGRDAHAGSPGFETGREGDAGGEEGLSEGEPSPSVNLGPIQPYPEWARFTAEHLYGDIEESTFSDQPLPTSGLLGAADLPLGSGLGQPRDYRNTLSGRRHRFNREAYLALVQDLRQRSTPGNHYGTAPTSSGLASRHRTSEPPRLPSHIWIGDQQRRSLEALATAPADSRSLQMPDVPGIAMAAATMLSGPIHIDGDLADWGAPLNPVMVDWRGDDATEPRPAGFVAYFGWSSAGLHVAATIPGKPGEEAPAGSPFDGESLEVWVDTTNDRARFLALSESAHQFVFTPLGTEDHPEAQLYEYLHGSRSQRRGLIRHLVEGTVVAWAPSDGNRYVIEALIPRQRLSWPHLVPGAIQAMNLSVNRGRGHHRHWQWSASKAVDTFERPETWGDVLLLGSDAHLRLFDPLASAADLDWVLPGMPVGLEIRDPDMNLDPQTVDRVGASVAILDGAERLFLIAEETAADSGVFTATFDTALSGTEADPRTLPMRAGDVLDFRYDDARAAFGERHRPVHTRLPVAWSTGRLHMSDLGD